MHVTVQRLQGRRLEARTDTASLVVDRPAAEAGESGAFRSMELVLAGLGTCTVGTMLSFAEREGIPVEDVRLELRPVVALAPERVRRIRMTMHVTGALTGAQLEALRAAAEGCKVHNTLHLGVSTELRIEPVVGTV